MVVVEERLPVVVHLVEVHKKFGDWVGIAGGSDGSVGGRVGEDHGALSWEGK